MAYVGGSLAPWFDSGPNLRFLRRGAARGGERLTTLTEMNTPVDTGRLRGSWRTKPVMLLVDSRGRTAARSGTETSVDYAPYVEYGTGLWGPKGTPYEIRPKKPDGWLHWKDAKTGEDVFARRVMHPGSPGNHMVAIAVGILEGELDRVLQPLLLRWAAEVERQNPGVRGR
jgi:hypothetical protein